MEGEIAEVFSMANDMQLKIEVGASWKVFFFDKSESFTEVGWLK